MLSLSLSLSLTEPVASAATVEPESALQRLGRSDVLVEASVIASEYQLIELDGEVVAITNYRLEIAGRPLMGAVSTNSLTLVLPGGPIGDAWMLVPGTPVLPVGTRLLLSGIEVRPGVVMASGFDRGILREFVTDSGDSVVADAFGTPVLDWRCESVGSPTRILPTREAPESEFDSCSDVGPIYDDHPEELAMPWSELRSALVDCVEQSGGLGAAISGGE